MALKATFDGAPPEGTINFGVGQPSSDLLPVELMRCASESFYTSAQALELNYGEMQGDSRFRHVLSEFLTNAYGSPADLDELLVTSGNSTALDFVCERFTKPGDVVLVEEPSYFLAFQIFHDHGLEIVSIPTDQDGLNVDVLEKVLVDTSATMLYTIPSFHNPGGQTLSASRRERLLQLSLDHDFLIVADEVYQLLYTGSPPPPAFGARTDEGRVISLGSFSKILAPGLRLGWIQTSTDLMAVLLESGSLNSGGSFNHLTSHVVRHAIELGLLDAHIEFLRTAFKERIDAMDEALHEYLGRRATWVKPEGGYFFWLEFPAGTRCAEIRKRAAEYQTGFQPGQVFSNKAGLENCLRLSFAHYGVDDIHEGVRRVARMLKDAGH